MTTLQQIRLKVRRLTATPSALQLPDSSIDEYIDTYYEIDMPAELKLWDLHSTYTFYTVANEDTYTLDVNQVLGVNPPVYIAGYQCFYTQSREQLFRIYPPTEFQEQVGDGTGVAGPYVFVLSNTAITRNSFYVSALDTNDITRTLRDSPLTESTGTLVDTTTLAVAGSINYLTGAVVVTTFGDTIPSTSPIYANYQPYIANRPTAVLFYNNIFTLRPVPDNTYKVTIESYVKPSQLLNASTDSPDLNQWWQLIAFGAALKVLEDRQDIETINTLMPRYDEQKQMALHRTILQQTPERTPTIYSSQNMNFMGNQYGGGF